MFPRSQVALVRHQGNEWTVCWQNEHCQVECSPRCYTTLHYLSQLATNWHNLLREAKLDQTLPIYYPISKPLNHYISFPSTSSNDMPPTFSSDMPFTSRSDMPPTPSSDVPSTFSSDVPFTARSDVISTASSDLISTASSDVISTASSDVISTPSNATPHTQLPLTRSMTYDQPCIWHTVRFLQLSYLVGWRTKKNSRKQSGFNFDQLIALEIVIVITVYHSHV